MLLLQLAYLYSGKATKISCKRIRTVRMACVFIVESLTAAVIMWVTWYDLKRMSSCSMGMLLLNKMFTFLWLCCDAVDCLSDCSCWVTCSAGCLSTIKVNCSPKQLQQFSCSFCVIGHPALLFCCFWGCALGRVGVRAVIEWGWGRGTGWFRRVEPVKNLWDWKDIGRSVYESKEIIWRRSFWGHLRSKLKEGTGKEKRVEMGSRKISWGRTVKRKCKEKMGKRKTVVQWEQKKICWGDFVKKDLNFQTISQYLFPKMLPLCLIFGSPYLWIKFSTHAFSEKDNEYFEPRSVATSDWKNHIPWQTDQCYFLGN